MPEAHTQGLQDCLGALRALPASLRGTVLRQAVYEGAEIFARAIKNAAPKGGSHRNSKFGPIAENIIIYERKRSDLFIEAEKDNALAVLVGPNKKAFYAYFVEHGFIHHTARSVLRRAHVGSVRKVVHTSGVRVAGRPWIKQAYDSVKAQAHAAMIKVFEDAFRGKQNG